LLSVTYILGISGSLERIVDIFLALAVATRHESRLYKLVRKLELIIFTTKIS
jgi:hypothetical protein